MSMDGTPNDDDLQGTDQSETINGGAGDDVINGGAGADTYVGGAGNDRYILADPDTIDTLDFRSDDQQQDILDISQLLPDGAEVNADNLKQFLKVNSNGVFVDSSGGNYFTEDSQVARFSANNPALSATIAVQVASGVIINYAWGDTAEAPLASSPADSVEDSESLNEVTGNASDDELSGTDENDLLSGGYGDDVLNGGAGADVYDGGAGSDRYVLSDTESVDTLHFVSTMHEKDTIDVSQILPAGATVDNISDYIRITEDGIYLDEEGNGEFGDDDLVAKFTEDSIFSGDNLELIIDDTDNTIDFSFSREIGSVLQGSQSYQTESQVTEKLVLRNRDGSELENGNSSETGFIRSAAGDKIELDLAARNLTTAHGAYGDERLDGTSVEEGETVRLYGRLGNDTLEAHDGNSYLDGGRGNDVINARGGRNVMAGGEGRDEFSMTLETSENTRVNWDNIYDFSSQEGHRDILNLSDILPAEATEDNINNYVQVTDNGVYIDTSGNALFNKEHRLIRLGKETNMDHLVDIRIADNSIIQLNRNNEVTTIEGTSGDDVFEAGEGSQILRGGTGDDVLHGDSLAETSSADSLFGGEGNDRLHADNLDLTEGAVDGGEGVDYLLLDSTETNGVDVDMASLNVERVFATSGDDVIDASGFDTDRGRYNDEGTLIDNEAQGARIFAKSGDDTITGGAGNDYIDAGQGNDILIDGDGRDMLVGGGGDDRFVLSDDNEIDHIYDFISNDDQQDIIDVTNLVPAGTTQEQIDNYLLITQDFVYLDANGNGTFNNDNRVARFGRGRSFTDEIRVMVDDTELSVQRNDAPEVGDALTRTVDEDSAIVLSQEELTGNITDRENGALTASNLTARNASITDDGNGNFTITPNENYNGLINIYFDVSDGALVVSNKLELTVNPVNDAPEIDGDPVLNQRAGLHPAERVNENNDREQTEPAIATTESGYIVAWASNEGSTSYVMAQKFNTDGTPDGEAFQVNTAERYRWEDVAIAVLDNGNIGIAYEWHDPGIQHQSFMTVFDADGDIVGNEAILRTSGEEGVYLTDVELVPLAGDQFVVSHNRHGNFLVYDSTMTITGTITGSAAGSKLSALDDGGFISSWRESGAGENTASFEIFDSTGASTSDVISFGGAAPDNDRTVLFGELETGDLIALYQSGDDLFVQKFDATGVLDGESVRVNDATNGNQQGGQIVALSTGRFVVTWMSDDGDNTGLYYRYFNNDMSPASDDILISSDVEGDQQVTSVTELADGTVTVTWQSSHEGDPKIYSTTLQSGFLDENSADGTLVGRVDGSDVERDTLTYSLTDDAGGRFAIDASSGRITVADSSLLDFESQVSHTVTVEVDDGNGGVSTRNFTINLADVNEDYSLSASGNVTTGLVGEVYDTDSEVNSLSDLDNLIANNTPSATFTSTSLDYGNASTIGEFLGSDADSLSADIDANASDSVGYSLTGYIRIPEGLHNFRVTSGDSYRLTIGERNIVDHFGTRDAETSTGYFTASEAGYYRFELVYWEQDDSEGLQITSSIVGGDALTSDVLFTSFPSSSYIEQANANVVADDLVLSDPELNTPDLAVVKITAGYVEGEDELVFTNQNGISGSWDSDTGTLTLTGSASIAAYQTALRSVSYQNSSDTPETGERILSYTVSDGSVTSEPLARAINITTIDISVSSQPEEELVNTDEGNSLYHPELIALGEGYISAWRVDSDNLKAVRAQKYNADMTKDGEEFTVNSSNLGDSDANWYNVRAAELNNGNYAITYDQNNPGDWVKSFMRVFDADGNEIKSEFEIGHNYYVTAITSLSDNYFATVSWVESNQNLIIEMFDDSGNEVRTINVDTGAIGVSIGSPDIVGLPDGGFVLTWRDSSTSDDSAHFQIFDEQGNSSSEIFNYGGANPSSHRTAKVAIMDDGDLLTIYQSGDNIFSQRWSGSGEVEGDPVMINTDESGEKEDVDVTVLADGSYYIVWSSDGQDGSEKGVYARRFDRDGNALTDEIQINETSADNQAKPQIIQTAGGSIYVQWVSDHEGSDYIYQTPLPTDHINENAANGTLVMVANSGDIEGDTPTYALTDDAGGRFTIDANTGHITVADSSLLDYERDNSHSIIVEASYSNGGSSTETFTVDIMNVNEADATTIGGEGNDILTSGEGNDLLTGGGGSDTFIWHRDSTGTTETPAEDTITDFSTGQGGDVLDLRDLLTGEEDTALDNFLHFNFSNGDTILEIQPDANGGVTQTITLQGVDLSGLGSTDAEIINNLLDDGNLQVD